MITTVEEYIAYLKRIEDENPPNAGKINLPKDENIYNINLNTRQIEAPEFLSVELDHNSETVYFSFDRYFDNMDLTTTVCVIQYDNKNAVRPDTGLPAGSYIYVVPFYDITYFGKDENKVLIPWMIEGPATAAAGPIEFAIMFYRIDAQGKSYLYKLNTMVAKSKILHGISESKIEQFNDFWISDEDTLMQWFQQQINDLKPGLKLYWLDVE